MFHIVSLNGVDSGNAVTLLCLPSFQSEVWPAVLVVLWTGADWAAGAAEAVRLSHVGFLPPLLRSRDVHVAGSVLLCYSACTGAPSHVLMSLTQACLHSVRLTFHYCLKKIIQHLCVSSHVKSQRRRLIPLSFLLQPALYLRLAEKTGTIIVTH